VKNCITHRDNICTLTDDDGNSIVNDSEKTKLFNKYFASIWVNDDGIAPNCNMMDNCDTLEIIEFNTRNATGAINNLKSNLSTGPDCPSSVAVWMAKTLSYRPIRHHIYTVNICIVCTNWLKESRHNTSI
jgi:hypothetical protein